MATGAYGDAFGAEREHWFTRAASAELLIEKGAIVLPRVAEGILQSRAVGLLHLFRAQRPAAAHADVSRGARSARCCSRASRGERRRSDGAERRVHLRMPLRARGCRISAAGASDRARSRARQAHRRNNGPAFRSSSSSSKGSRWTLRSHEAGGRGRLLSSATSCVASRRRPRVIREHAATRARGSSATTTSGSRTI